MSSKNKITSATKKTLETTHLKRPIVEIGELLVKQNKILNGKLRFPIDTIPLKIA